ncbi:hypothetical protein BS50DRAFT_593206 [Corynespora cassiicola Philippines]|uniref:Uncharacterized protein n=1 Tax=Corynespora cassiicola Philippines TaxID=1448308 RepID=A0A2T2N7A4_CORCC|nr:hypothetical protein BS50DRAFT_593206 [Corynespora cassiicola Philippines]
MPLFALSLWLFSFFICSAILNISLYLPVKSYLCLRRNVFVPSAPLHELTIIEPSSHTAHKQSSTVLFPMCILVFIHHKPLVIASDELEMSITDRKHTFRTKSSNLEPKSIPETSQYSNSRYNFHRAKSFIHSIGGFMFKLPFICKASHPFHRCSRKGDKRTTQPSVADEIDRRSSLSCATTAVTSMTEFPLLQPYSERLYTGASRPSSTDSNFQYYQPELSSSTKAIYTAESRTQEIKTQESSIQERTTQKRTTQKKIKTEKIDHDLKESNLDLPEIKDEEWPYIPETAELIYTNSTEAEIENKEWTYIPETAELIYTDSTEVEDRREVKRRRRIHPGKITIVENFRKVIT